LKRGYGFFSFRGKVETWSGKTRFEAIKGLELMELPLSHRGRVREGVCAYTPNVFSIMTQDSRLQPADIFS
jgi:hypothetical protein